MFLQATNISQKEIFIYTQKDLICAWNNCWLISYYDCLGEKGESIKLNLHLNISYH